MRAAAVVITSLLLAGCGGGGGANCVPFNDITGTWDGTIQNDSTARGNPGRINASIGQSGCEVGGQWNMTFQDSDLDRSFVIKASPPQTTAVDLNLTLCEGLACTFVTTCEYEATGTLVTPTEIVGHYTTAKNCSFTQEGDFDITLTARLTPTPTFQPVPTSVPLTPTPTHTPTPTP
jgi:hypothetical protein